MERPRFGESVRSEAGRPGRIIDYRRGTAGFAIVTSPPGNANEGAANEQAAQYRDKED